MKHFLITLFTLMLISAASYAKPLVHCERKGEQPASATEKKLLQKLIPEFAQEMGCEIGPKCLEKWNKQTNPGKYSIAWAKQCGPVIDGIYQLGDQGLGSTFTCQKNAQTGKTCCSPLGYEYVDKWMVCSE